MPPRPRQAAGEGEGDSSSSEEFGRGKKAKDSGPKEPKYWEMLGGVVFVLYIITYFIGKKRNTDLIIAWAEEFCTEGGCVPPTSQRRARNPSLLAGAEPKPNTPNPKP